LDKWGVTVRYYYSARDFSDGLSPCAIVLGSDVTEGYHIAKLPGCFFSAMIVTVDSPADSDFKLYRRFTGKLNTYSPACLGYCQPVEPGYCQPDEVTV
jgi:hypothetical protein